MPQYDKFIDPHCLLIRIYHRFFNLCPYFLSLCSFVYLLDDVEKDEMEDTLLFILFMAEVEFDKFAVFLLLGDFLAFVDEAFEGDVEVFVFLAEVDELEGEAVVVEVYAPKTEVLELGGVLLLLQGWQD